MAKSNKLTLAKIKKSNKKYDEKNIVFVDINVDGADETCKINCDRYFDPTKVMNLIGELFELILKNKEDNKNQLNLEEDTLLEEQLFTYLLLKHFTDLPIPQTELNINKMLDIFNELVKAKIINRVMSEGFDELEMAFVNEKISEVTENSQVIKKMVGDTYTQLLIDEMENEKIETES